jgi:hypothetical protein
VLVIGRVGTKTGGKAPKKKKKKKKRIYVI